MKKVLIASTALILVAGAAAAEVKVSGSARMGVVYDGSNAGFSSRVRINFDASGETDGGLSFGASVRNDQSGVGNTANGDSTVFVSGSFGKLTMGDVSGAADALVGQVSGVGYEGLNDNNEIGFLGATKTAAYYEYATGSLTFGLGMSQPNTDGGYTVGVKYAAGNYTAALGYETNDLDSQISVKGTAKFGAFGLAARVSQRDLSPETAIALSADYTMGATTLTAFAVQNRDFVSQDTFGLGASYDLGGGAAFKGGVVDDGTNTIADMGVTFSF